MRSTRILSASLLILAISACKTASDGNGNAAANDNKPPGEHVNPPYAGVRGMMRAKLAHAQAVLEGVAIGSFDQIQANAGALHRLSTMSDWQVHRTMEYNQYSDEFRWIATELARHAKEKKLHATTLDYMSMTMTCVKCHDYMHQAGLVKLDLDDLLAKNSPQ